MPVGYLLESGMERIERLPRWLRSTAYGAGFIWLLFGLRGGLLITPVIAVFILFTSATPGHDLLKLLAILLLMTFGGALAGAVCELVGRRLRLLQPGGRHAAGVIVASGYIAALIPIVRLVASRPLWAPPDGAEWFAWGFCSLFFGVMLGAWFFD